MIHTMNFSLPWDQHCSFTSTPHHPLSTQGHVIILLLSRWMLCASPSHEALRLAAASCGCCVGQLRITTGEKHRSSHSTELIIADSIGSKALWARLQPPPVALELFWNTLFEQRYAGCVTRSDVSGVCGFLACVFILISLGV